ncbi:hypothetical protein K5K93_19440 [Stenotrophomonas sp. DR822]|uniref:hypothetical protein n=1 Tax=Stenotrophomonas sp. DR822 TaxID=2871174 RepID=UPI001C96D2DE|nr:hypothetical protein [Stenotrophomonas sp. DR822]QZN80737.1 hypothetical protein K5K93_19440 [Stenotrophomonas sp. DR822]
MTRMLSLGARIGAVLVALLLVGGCERAADRLKQEIAATQNPWPKSSALHDPADRMLRRLIVDERYLTRIKQAGSRNKALQVGAQLTLDGIARLPPQRLEQRANVMASVLHAMPVEDCARISRATTAAEVAQLSTLFFAQLEKLPPADIDAWFEMSYQAGIAELEQRPPSKVSEAQIQAASEAFMASLPSDAMRSRAMAVMPHMETAPPADVCWASRTMFNAVATLPKPHRGTLAWLLAQQ